MNKINTDKVNEIKSSLSDILDFESDDEEIEYQFNRRIKLNALDFILTSYESESSLEFQNILSEIMNAITSATGCAEDLEILELILDTLFEKKIIDQSEYTSYVDDSSLERWL